MSSDRESYLLLNKIGAFLSILFLSLAGLSILLVLEHPYRLLQTMSRPNPFSPITQASVLLGLSLLSFLWYHYSLFKNRHRFLKGLGLTSLILATLFLMANGLFLIYIIRPWGWYLPLLPLINLLSAILSGIASLLIIIPFIMKLDPNGRMNYLQLQVKLDRSLSAGIFITLIWVGLSLLPPLNYSPKFSQFLLKTFQSTPAVIYLYSLLALFLLPTILLMVPSEKWRNVRSISASLLSWGGIFLIYYTLIILLNPHG